MQQKLNGNVMEIKWKRYGNEMEMEEKSNGN